MRIETHSSLLWVVGIGKRRTGDGFDDAANEKKRGKTRGSWVRPNGQLSARRPMGAQCARNVWAGLRAHWRP